MMTMIVNEAFEEADARQGKNRAFFYIVVVFVFGSRTRGWERERKRESQIDYFGGRTGSGIKVDERRRCNRRNK